ncbi:MAG: hypothetical protein IPK50_16545 [Fibrobacterota bacterium]|nr:hypothetical protein [Fibrobacterota bacterium]QQS03891.1 MAG: hypothetical protein IPK50_16545 [Fibrobacterota bacterium]
MSIFGIGAYFDHDVSADFIKQEIVGVGWSSIDAPELQEYLKSLKVGDIVYIKSAFGGAPDITVKGIGIISDNVIRYSGDTDNLVSAGRNVRWLSTEKFTIPRPTEKNNVRSNTVYEEFHPIVQIEIVNKITKLIMPLVP